jgi:VanZ family protein
MVQPLTQSRTAAIITPLRLVALVAQVALVALSSTKLAGDAADYAFEYYSSLFGNPWRGSSQSLPFHLAQKTVHFTLFFSLGYSLSSSLNLAPRKKFWIAAATCLVIGAASEALQLFTGRDPLIVDVILNAASGAAGAALAAALSRRSPAR